jgi:hypothetical protein
MVFASASELLAFQLPVGTVNLTLLLALAGV